MVVGPLEFYKNRIKESKEQVERIRDRIASSSDDQRAALKKQLEAAYYELHNWQQNQEQVLARLAQVAEGEVTERIQSEELV